MRPEPPADRSDRTAILPILIHIQANLDGDLSLRAMAARAGRSPSHFHRGFRARVGETPRRYVERLRLERAAVWLSFLHTTVLEVALAVGFDSHETFTRAFRRHFGVLPREVRKHGIESLAMAEPSRSDHAAGYGDESYSLSTTRIVTVEPMHLAFIRHIGPYEEVSGALFAELQRWSKKRGLAGYRPLLGIGHDAPGVTPADKLRFDAALEVGEAFPAEDVVGYQLLELGRCAVTTHVGSYATLPHAYGRLFERILALPNVHPRGLPAVEIYHEQRIDTSLRFNHTDVYLPVVANSHMRQAKPFGE